MERAVEDGAGPLGRAGIALVCAVLTTGFLLWGFPYDLLGQRLTNALAEGSGVDVSFAELGPYVSLFGPGFEASDVRILTPDGLRFELDRVRVRPAWSTEWLRLEPALHLELLGPGRVVGVLLARVPAFRGRLEQVDLARLPIGAAWPGTTLVGVVDATFDLSGPADRPEGSIELVAQNGRIALADTLPVPIPYRELRGTLRLGGDDWLRVDSMDLAGDIVSVRGSGRVARAASFQDAPIDLRLEVEADPAMRPSFTSLGLSFDPNGRAALRVVGSPRAPRIR